MVSCPIKEIEEVVEAVGREDMEKLVAHRGFHWSSDALSRPLENTLPAYEYAWTAGMIHCECDAALTSDGHLIVFHDATMERLALRKSDSYPNVTTLPLHEIMNTPLKNGSRIPTLKEVLDVAVRMGPPATLVIELKPDKRTSLVAAALCLLIQQNRQFIPHISLIFSFHHELIHEVNFCFKQAFPEFSGDIRPKMMLLTKTKEGGELAIEKEKFSGAAAKKEYVLDFSKPLEELKETTRKLLEKNGSTLDGVYFLYHDSLTSDGSIAAKFARSMSEESTCGVWLSKMSPDKLSLFRKMCNLGVTFVNSDLPSQFAES